MGNKVEQLHCENEKKKARWSAKIRVISSFRFQFFECVFISSFNLQFGSQGLKRNELFECLSVNKAPQMLSKGSRTTRVRTKTMKKANKLDLYLAGGI
jgi:hypothetical protein